MSDLPRDHQATADPDDRDDRRLLAAFAERDDRDALGQLLLRHAGIMFRVALRCSGNAADAEDAVQEACLDAMRAARSFRGEGSVRGWLLAAVHNRCRMRARGDQRRRQREAIPPPPPAQPPPEDLVAAAREALAKLPEHERAAVELRCIEGLAHAEIASATGRREATVRKQVERGLTRLRILLDRAGYATGAGAIAAALAAAQPPATPPAGLTGALAKAALAGPGAAAVVASGMFATAIATGLALLAVGGVGWWAAVPQRLAVVPLADPAPVVAAEPDVLDAPVTVRLHRADIAEVIEVLERQAGFVAVIPSQPDDNTRVGDMTVMRPLPRAQDAALVVEGVPLRRALDGLAASGWSWGRIAGRICLWRKLPAAVLAEAGERLRAAGTSPTDRAATAKDLAAGHDPDGLRALLSAVADAGEAASAARAALERDPTALLVLAEDSVAQRIAADALTRNPGDRFWMSAAGQVRAAAAAPRLQQVLVEGVPAETMVEALRRRVNKRPEPRIALAPVAARALGWMGDRAVRPLLEQVARAAGDWSLRSAALEALADLADPAALPALLALLSAPEPSRLFPDQLVRALLTCAPRAEQAAVVRAIFERLKQPDGEGLANFIHSSPRLTDPAAWSACLEVLVDRQRGQWVRRFACDALAPGSDLPEIREALLGLLGDRDNPFIVPARALAIRPDQALVDRLVADLDGGNESVWYDRVTTLGYCRLPSAAEALLERAAAAGDRADSLTRAALDTRQPFVPGRVRDFLASDRPVAVRAAAAGLAEGESPEATARLVENLLRDPEPRVRAAAVRRLDHPLPGLDRTSALLRAMDDVSGEVRSAAFYALDDIDPQPVDTRSRLLGALRDPERSVRDAACCALPLRLDDDAVWKAAEDAARQDPSSQIRNRVTNEVSAFVHMNLEHPRAVQGIELLSRMRADPDAGVRQEAQRGLDLLAGRHPLAAQRAKENVPVGEPPQPAEPPTATGGAEF